MTPIEYWQIYFTIALIVVMGLIVLKDSAFGYLQGYVDPRDLFELKILSDFWIPISIVVGLFWLPILIIFLISSAIDYIRGHHD